jgi:Peptidase family M23
MCALAAALVLAPGASAWAWPVDGPVLRPFVAEGDPYSGGQHRGIDIGAPTGSDVRSAATGVASFVGRLPHQGLCLTVRTADGYSVTLVHLGSIGVTTGTPVSEGDVVGTIGPSGDVEGTEPYVYLGIRLTADPNGYVDPLGLLPPRQTPEQPPVTQPQAPAPQPAPPPVEAKPPHVAPAHAKSSTVSRGSTRPASRPRTVSIPSSRRAVPPARRQRLLLRASTRATIRPRGSSRAVPRQRPVRAARALRVSGHVPPAEAGEPAEGNTHVVSRLRPTAAQHRSRGVLLLAMALVGMSLLATGFVRGSRRPRSLPGAVPPRPLRKMSMTLPVPEESLPQPPTPAHSPSRSLALREWPAASRTCRRLRGSVRHHSPVSPASRRLGVDGERNRRARDARHGRRRSRGAVST